MTDHLLSRTSLLLAIMTMLAAPAAAYEVQDSYGPDTMHQDKTVLKGQDPAHLVLRDGGLAALELQDPRGVAIRFMMDGEGFKAKTDDPVKLVVAGTSRDRPKSYVPRGDEPFYRERKVNTEKIDPIMDLTGWKNTGAVELHLAAISTGDSAPLGLSEIRVLTGEPEIEAEYQGSHDNIDVMTRERFVTDSIKNFPEDHFFWRLDIERPGHRVNRALMYNVFELESEPYLNRSLPGRFENGYNSHVGYLALKPGDYDNLMSAELAGNDNLTLDTRLRVDGTTWRAERTWDLPDKSPGILGQIITWLTSLF